MEAILRETMRLRLRKFLIKTTTDPTKTLIVAGARVEAMVLSLSTVATLNNHSTTITKHTVKVILNNLYSLTYIVSETKSNVSHRTDG